MKWIGVAVLILANLTLLSFGGALLAFWPHWQTIAIAAGLLTVAATNFVVAARLGFGRFQASRDSKWERLAQTLNVLLALAGLAGLLLSFDLWILSSQEIAASLALLLPPLASWLVIRRTRAPRGDPSSSSG